MPGVCGFHVHNVGVRVHLCPHALSCRSSNGHYYDFGFRPWFVFVML